MRNQATEVAVGGPEPHNLTNYYAQIAGPYPVLRNSSSTAMNSPSLKADSNRGQRRSRSGCTLADRGGLPLGEGSQV